MECESCMHYYHPYPVEYIHTNRKKTRDIYKCKKCILSSPYGTKFYNLRHMKNIDVNHELLHLHYTNGRPYHIVKHKCNYKDCDKYGIIQCERRCELHLCLDHVNIPHNYCTFCKTHKLCYKIFKCPIKKHKVCRDCSYRRGFSYLLRFRCFCSVCELESLRYYFSSRRKWIKRARTTGMFEQNIIRIVREFI